MHVCHYWMILNIMNQHEPVWLYHIISIRHLWVMFAQVSLCHKESNHLHENWISMDIKIIKDWLMLFGVSSARCLWPSRGCGRTSPRSPSTSLCWAGANQRSSLAPSPNCCSETGGTAWND
jgi:hypothetical protein